MNFVTSREVRQLREAQPPAAVVDVRIPEEYSLTHLAGALNHCVFRTAFIEDLRRNFPDFATPIIVYGAGSNSLESTEAARRLAEAGYQRVYNFVGGLAEWKADALPTLGEPLKPAPPILQGVIPVDLAETRIEWTGRNLLNKHWGTVGLKSGSLTFSEGWLTGGELVIDMTTIRCTDLQDEALNALLVRHLASPDFFDVERHPEARLVIRKAAPVPNGRPGVPNLHLTCDLALRGITRELQAFAVAGRTPEGRLAAQAVIALDRTEWGSAYGSARFFQNLGPHLVNDFVEIQVRLVA